MYYCIHEFYMKKTHFAITLLMTSSLYYSQKVPKKDTSKEAQIEGVIITKTKKAVEQKADRTIFDFSEQTNLNSGSVLEGMKSYLVLLFRMLLVCFIREKCWMYIWTEDL